MASNHLGLWGPSDECLGANSFKGPPGNVWMRTGVFNLHDVWMFINKSFCQEEGEVQGMIQQDSDT